MIHDWTSFNLKIAIKSTLESIYDAWTKSSEIEKWFLESCQFFDPKNQLIPREQNVTDNSTYEWKWYLYDISENGKLIKANGKDFIRFTFAGECLVDVELKESGEYILVALKQHSIPTDESSKFNIRIGCMEG